ncbi:sulfatase-like hydrolase/transferase [Postechiella marina]|uniref:Sulfatase-like hydrolase/transferase n=1 Tax=Postechiella marina TaxID=943941 RepID=A0ABP8C5W6_9FLAO
MNTLKKYKKIIVFHLVLNILFALFITVSSYYHIPLNSVKSKFMYFIHLCIVQGTFASILYFLSLNRAIFKVLFTTLFFILGCISFWTFSINISTSATLIEAALTTKPYIILDLISVQFVLFLVMLLVVLKIIFKLYKSVKPLQGISLFLPLSCLLFVLFFWADSKRRHSFRSKLPYSFFYAFNESFNKVNQPLKTINKQLTTTNFNKLNVVFVLGESLRADHLGINGYARTTTPLLSKRDNVVSYNNIFTNKTNTALSVPCILTDKSIYSTSKDSISSIYNIYNAFNVPTYWIGNQLLESSYKQIVNTNKEVVIIDKLKSYWSIGKKQDLELLKAFNTRFNNNAYGLYTLHMIGSHWWYEDKYTNEFRQYKPVVNSKYIPSLTKEQIINSYDNTILYLDYFLNELIKKLEKSNQPTVLIYLSDHGESLGENGQWLHSHTKALTKPGMLVWYSNQFKAMYPDKVKAIYSNKNKTLTTDILFHSLSNLVNKDSVNFNINQSIFYSK